MTGTGTDSQVKVCGCFSVAPGAAHDFPQLRWQVAAMSAAVAIEYEIVGLGLPPGGAVVVLCATQLQAFSRAI